MSEKTALERGARIGCYHASSSTAMVCLWTALACGVDADERMVRRYAECMADPNTALHRLRVSNMVGAVPLSAEAVEMRLRAQLERGGSHGGDQGRPCPLLRIGAGRVGGVTWHEAPGPGHNPA